MPKAFPTESQYYWCLLLTIPALTFSGVLMLDFAFASDDNWMLLSNSYIWDPNFFNVVSHIFTTFDYGQYSPLNTILYRLIYSNFGMNPAVFHSFNLIIHILNVGLVYKFATKIGDLSVEPGRTNNFDMFLGTLLFAVLPVHAETVSWIAASKILLCSTCMLISLLVYTTFLNDRTFGSEAIVYTGFICAYGFKEQAVFLPFVLIIIDISFKRGSLLRSIVLKIPMLMLSVAGVIWARFGAQVISNLPTNDHVLASSFEKVSLPFYCLWAYLYNLLAPINLSVKYFTPAHAGYVLLDLSTALLIFILIKKRKTLNKVTIILKFGVGFFLVSIICFLNIYPLPRYSVICDRYLYFASIGVVFSLPLLARHYFPRYHFIPIYIYILMLCCITYARCTAWSFN